ncbi:hypothetical protein BDV93DRAFT_609228 [Ceratobasidium sp. AG-I]|nr:hypothetical protein BDV93DRAFT_609228 [Ceratobasidium sp. AG-I]
MSVDPTKLCSQWIAARKQLSQAIDAFEAVCNALAALGFQAGAVLESDQPDFVLTVEAELPVLIRGANQLSSSLYTMKKLRNGSPKLVPINRLPSELLTSIFSIAINTGWKDWNIRDNRSFRDVEQIPLHFIFSVSSYWRYLCLASPVFWTRIRFYHMRGVNHIALWLERSHPCPLDLFSPNEHYYGRDQGPDELIACYSSRFRSLVFTTSNGYDVGWKILCTACDQHTETSVRLEVLAINASGGVHGNTFKNFSLPPKEQMDQYLKSVHTLYVMCRLFDDWTSTVFHNLTTLSLKFIKDKFYPTSEEFLDVLRASPRLCSLEVVGYLIHTPPDFVATPVTLDRLETLWLETTGNQFTKWLLNVIVPHQNGLNLTLANMWSRVSFSNDLPFSIPDVVRTLYISSKSNPECQLNLSGLAKSLSRLESLAFKGIKIKPRSSTAYYDGTHNAKLATLDLIDCQVRDTPGFISMLSQHPIRQLRMSKCVGCPTKEELLGTISGLVVGGEPKELIRMYSPFG